MRKLVLILGLFVTFASLIAAYFVYNKPQITLPKPVEQGFKNPLFYRPMYAYSDLWHTLITPYSITTFQNPLDKNKIHNVLAETYFCDLIENEYNHVKFDCYSCHIMFYPDHSCHHECLLYTIKRYDEEMKWYMITKSDCYTGDSETRIIKYP